jgi:hypothetical protein
LPVACGTDQGQAVNAGNQNEGNEQQIISLCPKALLPLAANPKFKGKDSVMAFID